MSSASPAASASTGAASAATDSKPAATTSLFGFPTTTPASSGGGLFGGSSSFNFAPAATFGSSATPSKKEGEDDEDAEDDGDEGGAKDADEDHAAEFKPLINLPEIEVKTLEEEEEVLYKCRSKLFVFVKEDVYGGEVRKNWWRERGLGDCKILKHKVSGETRLLMRQEKTHKICANHLINPSTELKPQPGSSGKSFTFTAQDFAEGETKSETFSIKFGTTEFADEFAKAFEAAKEANKSTGKFGGVASSLSSSPAKPTTTAAAPVAAPVKASSTPDALASGIANVSLNPSSSSSAPAAQIMTGAYGKRDPNDEQVVAAAKFASQTIGLGELVKVASARAQVVAGMNYKLALHIKYRDGVVHAHVATVYAPLPHTREPMRLTEQVHTGVVA